MPFNNYGNTNNAQGQLQADIGASATSIILQSGQGALFPTNAQCPFFVKIEKYDTQANGYRVLKREIIKIIGRSSDTLNCTGGRGAGVCPPDYQTLTPGTTAFAFNALDTITQVLTAEQIIEIQTAILGKLDSVGGLGTGYGTNKTKYIEPTTGNEVLKNTTASSSVSDTDIGLFRTSVGDENRVPFANIKNQLSVAGKYIQTVTLGENISSGTPTAMAVVNLISYTGTLTASSGSAVKRGHRIQIPTGATLRTVKSSKNSSSSSATIQLRDESDVLIKEISVASGQNLADMNWVSTGAIVRLCMNDSANFNSSNDYLSIASTQAFFPYTISGTTNNVTDNTNAFGFDRIDIDFLGKAYKARADKLIELPFAIFAGFLQGPLSYGATVDLNGNDGVFVSGFSSLTSKGIYYVSNTAGVISTTKGTVKSVIGQAQSTSSINIGSLTDIPETLINQTLGIATGPTYYHSGGLVKYTLTSQYSSPYAGNSTITLQFSTNGSTWKNIDSCTGALSFSSSMFLPEGYIRGDHTSVNNAVTSTLLLLN